MEFPFPNPEIHMVPAKRQIRLLVAKVGCSNDQNEVEIALSIPDGGLISIVLELISVKRRPCLVFKNEAFRPVSQIMSG